MKSNFIDTLGLTKKELEPLTFPILLWADLDNTSQIVIIDKSGTERVLFQNIDGGLEKFISEITPGADVDSFFSEVIQGDEIQHLFKIIEFNDEKFSWENLISEFKLKASKLPYTEKDFNKEVSEELNKNYLIDLKAGVTEALYNSMIAGLVDTATELGIETLAFSGPVVYQERFRQIVHKNLNDTFTVIMGN